MTDRREEIMQALFAVCQALDGVTAYRNRNMLAEEQRPAIVVMDGDESSEELSPSRQGPAPRRVRMQPLVQLLVSDQAEEIGSTLNALRARVINAVLADDTLIGLTHNERGPAYLGLQMMIENGRRIEGVVVLAFEVTYILRAADLAD